MKLQHHNPQSKEIAMDIQTYKVIDYDRLYMYPVSYRQPLLVCSHDFSLIITNHCVTVIRRWCSLSLKVLLRAHSFVCLSTLTSWKTSSYK